MLITPRPGAHRDNILKALEQVRQDASNLRGSGSANYEGLLRYLEWVTVAARLLQDQVSGKDVERLVQTRRYYALLGACGTMAGTSQQRLVNGLVQQELDDRVGALDAAVEALQSHIRRWSGPGRLAVADSSFYCNSPKPLADTDLHVLMGLPTDENIHLLFPIVVVDELDRLKEMGADHPRWRAGHTLGRLDEAITSGATGTLHDRKPGEGQSVVAQVTVEIVLDQPGHIRQSIADDEIIERAATIQAVAGREVRLLTCDTSQATRGRLAGLPVTKLPSKAGTGDEPPRRGSQSRGNGTRAQRKNRREAEMVKALPEGQDEA
ncbi:PIN domain-containing protein [Streptomyces ortus]|uniref:PIN domain-containing protein n=1 Tax=Streptomyces ortus TaxID=2867268 RepID=A0ABT3V0B7_9ACTN|nr:PIN domain-containing protein [Streptomyces ortus]MCX4233258.1 PIN domain-containing protein [Streptomyces ortus]